MFPHRFQARKNGSDGKLQKVLNLISIALFVKFEVWDRIPKKQREEFFRSTSKAYKRFRSNAVQKISGSSYDNNDDTRNDDSSK